MTRVWLLLLVVAVTLSSLALVWARHQSRQLFIELRELQAQRDGMDIEWGRLQLEQSTWATHARIERVAREELGMRTPAPGEIVILRPAAAASEGGP